MKAPPQSSVSTTWQCTKTRRSGYGAIELYAAIRGYGYWHRATPTSPSTFICVGEDLRRACLELARKAGHSDEEIQKRWPSLTQRECRTVADRPQERLTFQPKTEFTPQDLAALGCTTWLDRDNVINYGFDTPNSSSPWHFNPEQIRSDFNVMAVLQVTLPSVTRSGEQVSDVITSTPWNPIFVCLPDIDKEDSGCVFFPASDRPPFVFSQTDEHTVAKVSRWLAGDSSFTPPGTAAVRNQRDSSSSLCRNVTSAPSFSFSFSAVLARNVIPALVMIICSLSASFWMGWLHLPPEGQ